MPRRLRVEYAGVMCHVLSRGDRREAIFLDDVDRQDFLKTLAEACQKTDWQSRIFSGLFYGLTPHSSISNRGPNVGANLSALK